MTGVTRCASVPGAGGSDPLPITRDRYDAVLFDLDGVLTSTAAIHADADVYNPNAVGEMPVGAWPECQDDPACVVLDTECVEDAIVA